MVLNKVSPTVCLIADGGAKNDVMENLQYMSPDIFWEMTGEYTQDVVLPCGLVFNHHGWEYVLKCHNMLL